MLNTKYSHNNANSHWHSTDLFDRCETVLKEYNMPIFLTFYVIVMPLSDRNREDLGFFSPSFEAFSLLLEGKASAFRAWTRKQRVRQEVHLVTFY